MKRTIAFILIAISLFATGFFFGRYNAIHSAMLYDITDTTYDIDFGGSIHTYERGEN